MLVIWRQVLYTGTVKFFNLNTGFGFIVPDQGHADVFAHATAIENSAMNSLSEGHKVSFDIVADQPTGKVAAHNLRAA